MKNAATKDSNPILNGIIASAYDQGIIHGLRLALTIVNNYPDMCGSDLASLIVMQMAPVQPSQSKDSPK